MQPLNRRLLTEDRAAFVSNSNPFALGVADPGSSDQASRYDHVHPSGGLLMPWGTGYDGDLNFDGTTAVVISDFWGGGVGTTTFTPSSGVYTISQQIAGRIVTLGPGVVLACSQGATVYASQELRCPTGTAILHADGNAGLADGTAGAARAAGIRYAGAAGGAGNTGAGSAGGGITNPSDQWQSAVGGAGGLGSGGAGGAIGGGAVIQNKMARHALLRDPYCLLQGGTREQGVATSSLALLTGAGAGGGGGGDGTNKGGGGGAGAGVLLVNAKKITGGIVFRALGGNGGSPTTGNTGGGGGGGGGYVFVNSGDMSGYTGPTVGMSSTSAGTRTTYALGGNGGTKQGTGVNGVKGGDGWIFMTTWA